MGSRLQGRERALASAGDSDLDVAAVRYISQEDMEPLMCSVNGIASALGGRVFEPFTPDNMYVKVIGSGSLKEKAGVRFNKKAKKQFLIDAALLQDAQDVINATDTVEPKVSLGIDWAKPMTFDQQTDQLLVNLQDSNRGYSLDMARVFGAIQSYTHRRDIKSAAPIFEKRKPALAIGRINRYMLGDRQYTFGRNPAAFISDALYMNHYSHDTTGARAIPLMPNHVTLGGLRIVALSRNPESFHQSDYAGHFEGCEFEGLKLVRRTDVNDDRYPLAGDDFDFE